MKQCIVIFSFFVCSVVHGQTMAERVLNEARTFDLQHKQSDALSKYKLVLAFEINNYEALWNCSLLSSRIGRRETDKEKQKVFFLAAKGYAEKALKVNANDAQSNYVMAVAMGRMALIGEMKEKIEAAREIKKYAERALELAPNHPDINHVLAIWHLEVSELNWMERQIADKFYGGLPGASKDMAVAYLKKSIVYAPNYIIYHFDLGRIYKLKGEKENARSEFNKVISIKSDFADELEYKRMAGKILETL